MFKLVGQSKYSTFEQMFDTRELAWQEAKRMNREGSDYWFDVVEVPTHTLS